MKPIARFRTLAPLLVFSLTCFGQPTRGDESSGSLRILLVTGGCCHDYDFQTKALQIALKERGVDAVWTVVNEGGKGTKAEIELYNKPDWASGFDVVIHNAQPATINAPIKQRKPRCFIIRIY